MSFYSYFAQMDTSAAPAASAAPPHPPSPVPVMSARSLLGVLPELQADPLRAMERATFEYGPIVRMPIPNVDAFMVGSPALTEHVLVTNPRNYSKQTRGYDMLRLVMGNGLVTSEGTFWKRQRRIAQPAFHRERLARFGEVFVRGADAMVDGWTPGVTFDAAQALMRCTLSVVGQTLLSTDVTGAADLVGPALTTVLEHVTHRTLQPLSLPEWVPTPANLGFKRARAQLDAVVLGVIEGRRRGGEQHDDLLGMLMSMKDPETGESMDDLQLRDEVMTIFLAGHETTANTLCWTFSLLGRFPQVERALVAELREVLGERSPTMEDLPRLGVLQRVVKESLRLYPPVWSLGRRVGEDEVVDGFALPRDALVFLSPWVLHRLPEFWADPEAFDPDRWLVDDPRRNHGAYLPFSMGQRKCIGDGFALAEAQLILAAVLRRAHLTLVPGQRFEPEPVITLRPRHGVRVTMQRRQ
jgi:cytochrome P450